VGHGSSTLAIPTHYAQEHQEQLPIMPQLVNILRFFPREDFSCPCGQYPIETRRHILHECKRFNEYWNLRRDSIGHFITFLELNPNVFAFPSPII